jgi:hypothetical protein
MLLYEKIANIYCRAGANPGLSPASDLIIHEYCGNFNKSGCRNKKGIFRV